MKQLIKRILFIGIAIVLNVLILLFWRTDCFSFAENAPFLSLLARIALCVLIDFLFFFLYRKREPMLYFIKNAFYHNKMIFSLAKNDFKSKFSGSYLGIVWAFIQPIVTILIYWVIFEFGLKASSPVADTPFVLWFITGIIPWLFFQEAVISATNALLEYNYLVKKIVFRVDILPVVKLISAFFVHAVFVFLMLVLFAAHGKFPDIYFLQILYYTICVFCFSIACSLITSAVIVFFRDLGHLITILLQFGMWATPIVWNKAIMPEHLAWILKINPMYYVVEGYRDALINHTWFFQNNLTIYFWVITLLLFAVGCHLFKKMKPHFADVL